MTTSNFSLPTTPQSIARVLDAGTRLYTSSLKRLAALVVALQLVVYLPSLLLGLVSPQQSATPHFSPRVGIAVVIIVVLAVGPYLGVLLRLWRIANGEDIPTGEAIAAGYRLTPRALLASLLFFTMIIIGFILLIVPGIYLAVSLGQFFGLLVFENCGASASLRRSRELVKGHWWRTATVIAVPAILVAVVMVVVKVVPMFLLGIDFKTGAVHASPLLQFLTGTLGVLLNGLLTPWTMAVGVALFNDLRLRREGDDLDRRLADLSPAR